MFELCMKCGGKEIRVGHHDGGSYLYCMSCGHRGKIGYTVERAEHLWNEEMYPLRVEKNRNHADALRNANADREAQETLEKAKERVKASLSQEIPLMRGDTEAALLLTMNTVRDLSARLEALEKRVEDFIQMIARA